MFAKNIKKIRSVHGLSQQQFAELFDLKRATLGAYEEQRSNPKMDTVIRIANYFSIDMEDLLTKELTVNNLVRFNETMTTSPASGTDDMMTGIPYVSANDTQHFLAVLTGSEQYALPKIVLPISTSGKTAFSVNDWAMSGAAPSFLPKDIVIGERVAVDKVAAMSGQIVVVATQFQLLFRKAEFRDGILLLSANQSGTEPASIPTHEILACWKVVHVFHHSLPAPSDLEQRISALESKISGK